MVQGGFDPNKSIQLGVKIAKLEKPGVALNCETCELGLNEPENEKELEEDASKKQRNQAVLGLTARDSVSILLRPRSYDAYTAPRPPSRPRRQKHVQTPSPTLQAILFFWELPSPKIKGAGWGGGVQQQQQRKSAATAAAAAARARGNEINTDRRSNALLTCQFPVF